MGDYTRFFISFRLKPSVPEEVLNILQARGELEPGAQIPDHPFFKCKRWRFLFCGNSSYHPGIAGTEFMFREEWEVTIHSNFKNYDQEIEKFVEWIMPYIDSNPWRVLGFKDADADPDSHHMLFGNGEWVRVENPFRTMMNRRPPLGML